MPHTIPEPNGLLGFRTYHLLLINLGNKIWKLGTQIISYTGEISISVIKDIDTHNWDYISWATVGYCNGMLLLHLQEIHDIIKYRTTLKLLCRLMTQIRSQDDTKTLQRFHAKKWTMPLHPSICLLERIPNTTERQLVIPSRDSNNSTKDCRRLVATNLHRQTL